MSKTVITHCKYCLSLCGLEITVDDAGKSVESIKPDRNNAYSWGDFCKKGKAAAEMRNHSSRITTPMRRVGDRYEPATYEEALDDIAARLRAIMAEGGPDAVGSYHGNPLGFAFHDSIFHTALLDAIGTGNRFWVGSVDQNASHVVQEHMYGTEMVGLLPDIDSCDYFLLVGMDPAVSKFGWMESVPDGWNRTQARRAQGAKVVIVDPRESLSATNADTHVAPLPGSDWALLLGILKVILDNGLDTPSSAVQVGGVDRLRTLVAEVDLDRLVMRCDVPVEVICAVAQDFASAKTAFCLTHTGVAHNRGGTVGEWLGHALNVVTNRLDVPGGRRYERGLVDLPKVFTMIAPKSKHLSRLRGLPPVAGYHALAELADEITTPGRGQIRGMLIASGNPVISGPEGQALDAALESLDLLVAVDIVQRESHRHAHWLIPGTHWLERSEFNPMFSSVMDKPFAQISRQTLPLPDGVMEEWDFYMQLALRMRRPLFGKPGVNGFVRTTKVLAKLFRRPNLAINGRWIEWALVSMGRRVKYRDVVNSTRGLAFGPRRYGDLQGVLMTPDKRVNVAPEELLDACRELLTTDLQLAGEINGEFPFHLISRRRRESMNSWLNELPTLHQIERTNHIEIQVADAQRLGVSDGQIVRVSSASGTLTAPARLVKRGREGVVVMPFGWGSRVFDPTANQEPYMWGTNRNTLTSNKDIDPLSQTAAFNSTRVRVEPLVTTASDISRRT